MSTVISRIACPEVAHDDAGAVGRRAASEQGLVRLKPEVQVLLWCILACWNHMVRSQLDAAVSASTNHIEGWFGCFKACARRVWALERQRAPSTSCV